jgi:hypothetical protein
MTARIRRGNLSLAVAAIGYFYSKKDIAYEYDGAQKAAGHISGMA